MFPLLVDLTNRLAVVVGGGPVGRRKARALLDAGAIVRLVSLESPPADFAAPRLVWLREPYAPDHLAGASLVFAAADAQLNRVVMAEARRRGVWVNCADDPMAGDFVLPATLRRRDFVLAVGTHGAAPTLAKRIRDRLEDQFDNAYADWVSLMKEFRPLVQERIANDERRRALYERWAEASWLERLRREGIEVVRRAMREELGNTSGEVVE